MDHFRLIQSSSSIFSTTSTTVTASCFRSILLIYIAVIVVDIHCSSRLLPPPLPLDYNFPASSMPSTIKTSINHPVPSLTLSDLSFPFRLTTTLNQVGYHLAVVVLKHNTSSTSRKTSVSYERAHCVYLLLSAAYI